MKQLGGFAVGIVLIWAPVAYAQGPPLDTYGGVGGVVGDVQQGAPPPGDVLGEVVTGGGEADGGPPDLVAPTELVSEEDAGGVGGIRAGDIPGETAAGGGAPTAGALPFTGLDVALMLAGGVLLLGVGLCVRRLSRPVA